MKPGAKYKGVDSRPRSESRTGLGGNDKNEFSMLDASVFAVLLCQGYEGTSYSGQVGGQTKIDVWLSKCIDEWMHRWVAGVERGMFLLMALNQQTHNYP